MLWLCILWLFLIRNCNFHYASDFSSSYKSSNWEMNRVCCDDNPLTHNIIDDIVISPAILPKMKVRQSIAIEKRRQGKLTGVLNLYWECKSLIFYDAFRYLCFSWAMGALFQVGIAVVMMVMEWTLRSLGHSQTDFSHFLSPVYFQYVSILSTTVHFQYCIRKTTRLSSK